MKAIEWHSQLRLPSALYLIYPSLSFEISAWMEKDTLKLLEAEKETSVVRYLNSILKHQDCQKQD